jgi:hypothetical protein
MRYFSLLMLMGLLWSSCETDFDLEGDWKDIPVVYAFFSAEDDNYYVRVEKAFLQPGGNAAQIAQIADSIYYAEGKVTVTLEKLSTGQQVVLTRIDGRDEGLFRDSGDFAQTPNILYKASRSDINLRGGDAFRIIVDRGGDTTPATATSAMVEMPEFANLSPNRTVNFGDYSRLVRVEWRANGPNARVYDLRIRVRYLESDPDNPAVRVPKELVWVIDKAVARNLNVSAESYQFQGASFYQAIANELEPLTVGTRRFTNLVYEVTAAGKEIEDYLRIANANIGITSSQAIPVYTNVTGGVGIVSSRYTITSEPLGLTPQAVDSLLVGSLTKNLNFVP